jgi:hypothetical protein
MQAHTRDNTLLRRMLAAALLASTMAMVGSTVPLAARALGQTAANNGKIDVEIAGADAGSTIEIAMNGGKVAAVSIGPNGAGAGVLDVTNMSKVQAQVWVRVCKDGKVQILLYTGGGTPPKDENCDDRPAGFIWLDRTTRLVVNVKTGTMTVSRAGMSTKTKIILGTLGAGAATGAAIAAGNGSGTTANPPATPTTPTTPTTPAPPTTPATPPFQFLVNKTYNNQVTRGTANCSGFAPSASTQLRFTNIDPQTGRGSFVHIHSGTTTLNYAVQDVQKTGDTSYTIVGTGTVTFGTTTYQLRITVMVNGNTDSKNEQFICAPGQETVYTGSGSAS